MFPPFYMKITVKSPLPLGERVRERGKYN